MPIASVIQKGSALTVYDERGRQIGIIPLGNGGDTFSGYTGSTVSVRRGSFVVMYDEGGRQTGLVPAR